MLTQTWTATNADGHELLVEDLDLDEYAHRPGVLGGNRILGTVVAFFFYDAILEALIATTSERVNTLGQASPMLTIVISTIGGIYLGVFTPSEAAAVGALELARGRPEQAEEALRSAVNVDPRALSPRLALANFLATVTTTCAAVRRSNGRGSGRRCARTSPSRTARRWRRGAWRPSPGRS